MWRNSTAHQSTIVCPGYDGEQIDAIELILFGRVSPGTEHQNDGKSQAASMLVNVNLLVEKKHFKKPVVLHGKYILGIGDSRHRPEDCLALMEAIKAILYSNCKEIELWINDLLRLFTESEQFDFLVGTLRALDPKKTITLRWPYLNGWS